MPKIISSTLSNASVRLSFQRKIFKRQGKYYLFWADQISGDSQLFYRCANSVPALADEENRSATTAENSLSQYGNYYDVHYDDVNQRVGIAWVKRTSSDPDQRELYFKYGDFAADGTINWAGEHKVDETVLPEYRDPTLGRSASGKWGIFLKRFDGNDYQAAFYTCNSATPSGTPNWQDQGNIPSGDLSDAYRPHRVCQVGNSGDDLLLTYRVGREMAARRWNGSTLEAEKTVNADVDTKARTISPPVVDNDGNVHLLCFNDRDDFVIKHIVFSAGDNDWQSNVGEFASPAGKHTDSLTLQIDGNQHLHTIFKKRTRGGDPPETFYHFANDGSGWIDHSSNLSGDLAQGYRDMRETPTMAQNCPDELLVAWVNETDDDVNELWMDGVPVVIIRPPVAAFSADPMTGSAPLAVSFTDQSQAGSSPITSWAWDFGDGNSSSDQNPSHTYAAPGEYTVKLTVSDGSLSDTATAQTPITVNAVGPTAQLAFTPGSGAPPLTVNFTDQSQAGTNPITIWSWDFGDGQTSDEQHPTHTYNDAGKYTVKLTVSDGTLSDTATAPNQVAVIAEGPAAQFSADPMSGSAPLSVSFTDQSQAGSSPITSWTWEFGDGNTSSEQNPTHQYASPGDYTVKLTVSDGSLSDTATAQTPITVNAVGPTAQFTHSPENGNPPLAVSFTDQSQAGTNPITIWSWDFGDGQTSDEQNPSHTYNNAGQYTVKLTVSDGSLSDTATAPAPITVTAEAPVADFSANPQSGEPGDNVQFTDSSTPGSSPISSWQWDFGDGGSGTEQHPSHAYQAPGTYTVKLTVSDGQMSDSKTRNNYITIEAETPPVADFSGVPTVGEAPLTVQFTDASTAGSNPINSWHWHFGDGNSSNEQNPSHTYQAAGQYQVSLKVSDGNLEDTKTRAHYVSVTPPPKQECKEQPIPNALCYLLAALSGLIGWLFGKTKCIRFHGLQSFLTFLPIQIILFLFAYTGNEDSNIFWIVAGVGIFLWLLLIVMALRGGKRFKLPIIGNFAEKVIFKN